MNDEIVQPPVENIAPTYKDDDLVYVDPDARTVVGLVEWHANGKPKALPMKRAEEAVIEEPIAAPADGKVGAPVKGADKGKMRRPIRRERYYPWGTYRSMKRVYKIEGKQRKEESQKTLDEVIEKALKEPFWD